MTILPSVLIIETSRTLCHALQRQFFAQGYDVVTAGSYAAGLRVLTAEDSPLRFTAIVLGFPINAPAQVDDLLLFLDSSKHRNLPTLIMAHTADAIAFNWVARRPRSAMLLWESYAECTACLEKLLTAAPTAPADATAKIGDDIRVLFVDDSRTVRVSYKRLLSRHGYTVETAANVDEAVAKAHDHPFDIAIIDYFMPGANGDVLCRKLRDDPETAGITTAIITGTYLDNVIKETLAAGAVECMFKNEAKELFLARLAAMSRSIRITKSIDAERQRLAGILGSVGEGVYGVDTAGRITFINPAARNILGYDGHEPLIGKSAHQLFHHAYSDGKPNPTETCFLQQAYHVGDELREWQTVFWHQTGKPISVECTVYPLKIDGVLQGSVVAFRDISERLLLEKELLWQANHDPLTKLHNRNYFERQLDREVNRLKRSNEISALLYIDLDRFKYINDTAGHIAGDQLLIELGMQLQSRMRESDLLARLGGDEFAVILRNVDRDNIQAAADSFREILEQHNFVYGDKHYRINGSIGVALIGRETQSPGEVLSNADIACHIAKGRGRNQTHIYLPGSDEKVAMHMELGWSARLQEALKSDGFELHFQPIAPIGGLDLKRMPRKDGEIWNQLINSSAHLLSHYEVLIRFVGSRGELVSPNAFLPTAERFGLMPQIDTWVLTRAVKQLAQMNARGLSVTFTINISGQTLDADVLVPCLKRLLAKYKLDSKSLIFEITETSAIANIEGAKRLINELRGLGCRFALDDFGSGFSSFYHLKHLAVDFIKIDGHFVQGMATDPTDRAIVTSINDIAHSFGKQTIAEFVENPAILEMLHRHGVDYAQGYYISSPRHDFPATKRKTA